MLAILIIVVSQLSLSTKMELAVSQNVKSDTQNYYATLAAVDKAKLIIAADTKDSQFDDLTEFWARDHEAENFSGTSVKLSIEDEERKFNINRLRKQDGTIDPTAETQFKRLVKTLGHTEETANNLMENIADYLDENTQGEYETDARNDKFIMPEELLFLKEATEEIVYGKTEDDKTTPGLLQFITTWSSGQINVNTASSEALQCLSDKMTPEIASAIITYRQETGEDGKPKSYKTIQDLRLVTEVTGEVFADISNYVTTTSIYFSAIITCQNSKLDKGSRTVLMRTPKGTRQMFFDIDYTPKAIIRPEITNEE